MPSVNDNALKRKTAQHEKPNENGYAGQLEDAHRRLHPGHGLADAGGDEKDELSGRRIDRRGVAATVDLRIDRLVAQRGQVRVRRDVAIGIDAGRLDPAVPNITVEIIREIWRAKAGAAAPITPPPRRPPAAPPGGHPPPAHPRGAHR